MKLICFQICFRHWLMQKHSDSVNVIMQHLVPFSGNWDSYVLCTVLKTKVKPAESEISKHNFAVLSAPRSCVISPLAPSWSSATLAPPWCSPALPALPWFPTPPMLSWCSPGLWHDLPDFVLLCSFSLYFCLVPGSCLLCFPLLLPDCLHLCLVNLIALIALPQGLYLSPCVSCVYCLVLSFRMWSSQFSSLCLVSWIPGFSCILVVFCLSLISEFSWQEGCYLIVPYL